MDNKKVSSFVLFAPQIVQENHHFEIVTYEVCCAKCVFIVVSGYNRVHVRETQETTRGQSLCDRLIQPLKPVALGTTKGLLCLFALFLSLTKYREKKKKLAPQ